MPKRRRRAFLIRARRCFVRLKTGAAHKKFLKDRGQLKCEACNWFDPLIQPFYGLESHHIRQVCDGGTHEFSNRVVFCPICHRLADSVTRKNREIVNSKSVLIALIREHRFQSEREMKHVMQFS
jgi:hypothetical protein